MQKGPGQPTKYQKQFHNEDFLRLSKLGKSITQIALEWDIDRGTIYEWANTHKEFSNTVKRGRTFAEGWYMNLGQLAASGQAGPDGVRNKIDVGMFVWLTKNMFKWSDRISDESPNKELDRPLKHLTDEELDLL